MRCATGLLAGIYLALHGSPLGAVSRISTVKSVASTWTAQNAAYRVTWTTADITATKIGDPAPVFSFRAFAAAGLATLPREPGVTTTRRHVVTVVSLTGSLLALRDEISDDVRPAAHPAGAIRYWTIDLSRTEPPRFLTGGHAVDQTGSGRVAALTGVFRPSAVRDALAADAVVRSAVDLPPGDLGDLVSAWRDGVDAQPGIGAGHLCYAVDDDVLTSFAVIGIANGSAKVRIGLGGQGACRANFVQIGLTLPIAAGSPLAGSAVIRPAAGIASLITIDKR